jgi:hypothetical protein
MKYIVVILFATVVLYKSVMTTVQTGLPTTK